MASVWVAYRNHGSEGHSEPLRVFASKGLAELWVLGSNDSYGQGGVIREFEVIDGKTLGDKP